MRIPGLGCLKGCLFTLLILFVASWLIWELSPLQDWIGTGKSYWDQLSDWFGSITGWIENLGGPRNPRTRLVCRFVDIWGPISGSPVKVTCPDA